MGGGVGDLLAADEAMAAVDVDVRLVAEGRDREVALDRAVGLDLAFAGLDGPAGVGVLLRRLGGLIGPDLPRLIASLDRRLLLLRVALSGCRDEARIDDLARHRQIAGSLDRLVETGKELVERTAPDQRLAEVPQGIGIRHRIGDRKPAKPHPRKAIAHQMLGRLEAQPMLRHEIEHLELQDGIERRPAALRAITGAERLRQHRAKQLEVDDLEQLLQRITLCRQLPKAVINGPEPGLSRQRRSPCSLPTKLPNHHSNSQVSGAVQLVLP